MNYLMKMIIFLLMGLCYMDVVAQQVQKECQDLFKEGEEAMNRKNYEVAIKKFNSAAVCDEKNENSAFVEKCKSMKKKCEDKMNGVATTSKKALTISSQFVKFDAEGGIREVVITGNNWNVSDVVSDWYSVAKKSSSVVISAKPNTSIRSHSATILISDGTTNKEITVTQGKAEEYLRLSAGDLSFSSRGNQEEIVIQTNTEWNYSGAPSWCTVKKNGDKLIITASPNNSTKERPGSILISSNSLEKQVMILQNVGNETLSASKNNLSYSNLGGKDNINIYTDSDSWTIGDFPKWCSVTRVNEHTISVECMENTTTKDRNETILIRTNKQTLGLKVSQKRGYEATMIQPTRNSKMLGGRNISFGITAGLVFPSVSTSASGDYLGSIVNYGYGNDTEKPSYKAEMGFTVGALADFRLYKNLYVQIGLNYTNLKYKNSISDNYFDEIKDGNYSYEGQAYDDFTENYTMSYIDVPIVFSYRHKLSEKTNLQLNLGPYISYGLSGKMKLSGTTDWPSLDQYYDGIATGENYYMNAQITGKLDMFEKNGSLSSQYTTGNSSLTENDYDFKDSPLSKFNYGLTMGVGIELSGFNIGASYDLGLSNLANKDFWNSKRLPISEYSSTMENYKFKLSRFSIKVGYIFRW